MWGHFGDRFGDCAGTYFYERAEHLSYGWNIFDQVLFRSSLAGLLPADQPKILTSVGQTSLLMASGVPDQAVASDHLPVLFQVDV